VHSLHCVECIVSTKQARRLQTGLLHRDTKATMMSGFGGTVFGLWACYCSWRTFSDLALVFFVILLVSFCIQICWTEDASLTRNRFPSKAICDQIHPFDVLMTTRIKGLQ